MVKYKRHAIFLALACGIALFAIGCASDKEDDTGGAATDEQALSQLMQGDQDIEDVNAFEGEPDLGMGNGGGLDEPITPIRWGRIGVRERTNINVEIQGDTLATITRTMTYNGQFRVLTEGADSGSTVIYNKPMQNQIVRKAHAKRIHRTRFPRDNWRIYEVTPEVLTSRPDSTHSISPVRVELFDSSAAGIVPIADITDPLNTWFSRDSLPVIGSESTIKIRVTENNPIAAVGVVHPHVYFNGPRPRRLMTNDGGVIFEGSYSIGVRRGVYMVGLDLINHLTIYDSVAPYDAGAWGIPYRVSPQE